jgi:hypothetical protein
MRNQYCRNCIKRIDMDTLSRILRKVETVQRGLLRTDNDNGKLSWQARAGTDNNLLNCIIEHNETDISLLSRNVSLIQKDKHDYLYITCRVKEEVKRNTAIIMSLEILRACWFTRRSRGSVTWLQEKYMYDALPEMDIAS